MNWNQLNTEEQLQEINELSKKQPVLIFKHSKTCSISATALSRLERSWNPDSKNELTPFYLDLLSNRALSSKIAETYNVEHESPQAIIIKDGKAIYNESHFGISLSDMLENI